LYATGFIACVSELALTDVFHALGRAEVLIPRRFQSFSLGKAISAGKRHVQKQL